MKEITIFSLFLRIYLLDRKFAHFLENIGEEFSWFPSWNLGFSFFYTQKSSFRIDGISHLVESEKAIFVSTLIKS